MKKINLQSLELKNFKGIKSFKIDFNEKETSIHGANGSGKTTIFDAFTWLLFDKDSNGSAQFNIKTLDENNEPIHQLDHSVIGVFDVDGRKIELKKVYREKWVTKTGESDTVFNGHETDYYFNDAPVKKNEYLERVSEIVSEDMFKVLSSPLHFNQINWKERREMLLKMAGEISNDEIIDSLTDCNTDALREILTEDKSFEDELKSIKAKKKKLKDDLKEFPSRIDEVSSQIVDDVNADEIQKGIKDAESVISAKQKELESISKKNKAEQQKLIDFDNKVFAKKQEIENVRREITKLEATHKDGLKDGLRSINQSIDNKKELIGSKGRILNAKKEELDELNRKIKKLRTEVVELKTKEFQEPKNADTCDKCGQKLADSSINIEELRLNFINKRDKEVQELTNKGVSTKTSIDVLTSEISDIQKEYDQLNSELSELETKKEAEQKRIDNNAPFQAPKELTDKINDIEIELSKMERPEIKQADNTSIHNAIKEQRDVIDELKKQMYVNDSNDKSKKRIEELKQQQKEVATRISELEGVEFAIEKFDTHKMDVVETRVNKMFSLVKFKMFEDQINGGVNAVCDCLIDGVPFSDLNTASKINAGIDIINSLKNYFNVSCPVFIDNRESITKILENDLQIINLVVDENCKSLTVNK